VRSVFARYEMSAPDNLGCAILALDGAEYEVFGPKPDEPEDASLDCLISVRGGFTPSLATFLYDLCAEGQMVLMVSDDDAPGGATVYCPASVARTDLPKDEAFETLVQWSTPEQLAQGLADVFGAFASYRDRVVPDAQQSDTWWTRVFQTVFGRKS
jgi:hypothetical protein